MREQKFAHPFFVSGDGFDIDQRPRQLKKVHGSIRDARWKGKIRQAAEAERRTPIPIALHPFLQPAGRDLPRSAHE
jgi:hypothetical protein